MILSASTMFYCKCNTTNEPKLYSEGTVSRNNNKRNMGRRLVFLLPYRCFPAIQRRTKFYGIFYSLRID